MSRTRKREGEPASPALILLSTEDYVEDVPKYNVINSKNYMIGRSLDSNFILMKKCISRTHCSILFDENTNKWSIVSHVKTRKAVSVQGSYIQQGEPVVLECGHKIFVTPFFAFKFKCSDAQCKRCSGFTSYCFKKIRLSDEQNEKEAKPEADSTDNVDLYANPVPSCSRKSDDKLEDPEIRETNVNDLEAENERYKEEIRKYKETVSWQESRIKFLELKIKEKEKREVDLETLKEETEILEKQNADLKRNLAKIELLQLEYKNVLETDKYREEDSRNKDALQAKITALEEELQGLKDDNANLINDICATVDDLAKMTEKYNSLEEKMKQKIDISVSSPSTSGVINPNVSSISTKDCQLPPALPFEIFRNLFKAVPINSPDGVVLRRLAVDHGTIRSILECLATFTHHSEAVPTTNSGNQSTNAAVSSSSAAKKAKSKSSGRSRQYWAKGTGYASGNTSATWDVTQTLAKQRLEEERVTLLFQILACFINPDIKLHDRPSDILEEVDNLNEDSTSADHPPLPVLFVELVENSCLIPVLASYLRNDSVLDMARRIPLYRAILVLLRTMSFCSQTVKFLLPDKETSISIVDLLRTIESCVDTYSTTLQKSKLNVANSDKDLNDFISDVRTTTRIVEIMTVKVISIINPQCGAPSPSPQKIASIEEIYLRVMKELQFDTCDMIIESANGDGYEFNMPYHFERNARADADKNRPARVKRLAQETATLSTSLPLSYSSTVFVRGDTARLDVMKVLIIGPADTPYANGCFEFDVYFPPAYPNTPMLINLKTTGRGSVRFNPNLYNDGKVCLSVLNTWSGRPEEKWNSQTSSFLQVLVSIQSLILVPDPYFNEPGFERSRGTSVGDQSSRLYNANIMAATVQWAMIDQIRNPSPCFKDIIHSHFWIKKNEVIKQVSNWVKEVSDTNTMKSHLQNLTKQLATLKRPAGVSENEGKEVVASSEPEPIPSTSAAGFGSRVTTTTSWYKLLQSTSGFFSSSK